MQPEFTFDYTLNARRLEISRVVSEHEFHVRWTTNAQVMETFVNDVPFDSDEALEEFLYEWYKMLGN
jgi:hypothetical protein